MQIKPIFDYVLIEPIKEEKTKSGILIPETATQEGPKQGMVIAVGPGKKDETGKIVSLDIKPGDRVLFTINRYASNEVKNDDKEYLIIKAEDILAILE